MSVTSARSVASQPPSQEAAETGAVVRRVARSGMWSTAGYVMSASAGFFVAVIAGRGLGPAGFGRYSYYTWLVRLAATVLSAGIPALLGRFVSEYIGRSDAPRARGLLSLAMRANIVIGPACGVAVASFVLWREHSVPLALVLAAASVLTVLAMQLEGFMSGLRAFPALARVALVSGIAQVALVLVAFATRSGWQVYLSLQALAIAVTCGAGWLASRRTTDGWRPAPLPRDEIRRALRFAGVMAIVTVANEVIWGRPELFFLDRFRGPEEVGLYSAALRLSAVIVVLPALATRVLLPEFSWLLGGGKEREMVSAYRAVCKYVALIGVPLAVGGAGVADLMVETLYGRAFSGASAAAAILLGGSLAGGLAGAVSAAVFAGPRAAIVAKVGAGVVALNVLLDIVLIGRYGLLGAAVATTVSQVLGAAIGIWYATTRLRLPYPVGDVARLVLCGAAAAVAARSAAGTFHGPASLVVAVVAGAVVYVTSVLAWRVVTVDEIRRALRRSPARAGAES